MMHEQRQKLMRFNTKQIEIQLEMKFKRYSFPKLSQKSKLAKKLLIFGTIFTKIIHSYECEALDINYAKNNCDELCIFKITI